MCGSGTALVEAATAGLSATGVDLNPIATLVSRAKTAGLDEAGYVTLRRVADKLRLIAELVAVEGSAVLDVSQNEIPSFHNRSKWFSDHVTHELAYGKRVIADACEDGPADVAYCALSAILVGVSNQESETRWCAKSNSVEPGETLVRLANRITDSLSRLAAYQRYAPENVTVHTRDARALPLDDASVDLVVTSPPYANSHDYYLYNKLRMFWLGHDVTSVQRDEIGSRNRHSDNREDISSYVDAMSAVMLECARVAKPGAVAAFVVADAVIRGMFYEMDKIFDSLAVEAGFHRASRYRFGHQQFNASFQRGFGTRQPKKTHVLVYVRAG